MSLLKCALLGTFLVPVAAWGDAAAGELSGRALLDKARDFTASAPSIRRTDTTEQSSVIIVGQNRLQQKPQTNVATIEIDMQRMLARQTTNYLAQQLIMLKLGEKAAMKLGAGAWEVPAGPFEAAARDMGNLFVCEIETPEDRTNAPDWKVVGTGMLDGIEAYVVQTEGNSAVKLAQERMTRAIAKTYSNNPTQRPSVHVLEYSAKHWISKSDFSHLQAVQVSKVQLSLPSQNGQNLLIEQSSTATTKYSYGRVTIDIPEEAQRLLSPRP